MKDHSSNDKGGRSRAVANEVGDSTTKSAPTYQIDDRRSASVMQRKFRNLANGLASANIIQNQPRADAPAIQPKANPFIKDPKDSK